MFAHINLPLFCEHTDRYAGAVTQAYCDVMMQNELELAGYLENNRREFWFCCHMLSGNGQAVHICIVVDTGKAGIHYSKYGGA